MILATLIIGACLLSLVIWYILDILIGIRVSEEDELTGLDTTELGMDAYPDFSKS